MVIQCQLGIHAVHPGQLGFHVLQMPQLRHLHAGIFEISNVIGWLADPVLATGLADLCTGLDLFEDPDHLFFGELRFLHAELLGVELYFQVDRIKEDASSSRSRTGLPAAALPRRGVATLLITRLEAAREVCSPLLQGVPAEGMGTPSMTC